jgi:drug/metabolite transporter (DMT)-like permease
MEILLALGAAVSYGVSDFTGGLLTRRVHVLVVFLVSQVVSAALLVAAVVLWAGAVSWPGVAWGAAAGLAGVFGTGLLYQGLAIGRMSVVAPITGLLGAGLPVLFGLAAGERPGLAALIGIVTGLAAVVVISLTPEPPAPRTAASAEAGSAPGTTVALSAATRSRQAVLCAFGAGIGFGLFYVLLERSPTDSGLWPMLGTRISLVAALGLAVLVLRLPVRLPAPMGLRLAGLGIVNTAADLLFLLATRAGLLSVVAVITSMYPAVTVAMARMVLRERIAARQFAGLVVAAISVVLIALG